MDYLYYHGTRLVYAVKGGVHLVPDRYWELYLKVRHEVPAKVQMFNHLSDVLSELSGDHERPSRVVARVEVVKLSEAVTRAKELLVNERWDGGQLI